MEQHINIDLSKIVGAITGVILHPFSALLDRLHAEGRVTDAEMETLRQEYLDRMSRLDELVVERLGRSHDA